MTTTTQAPATSFTPPTVEPGRLVGFPRTSKSGTAYMSVFYRNENGQLHQLSIIKNISAKSGKVFYGGYGENFAEAPAETSEVVENHEEGTP